MSKKSKPSIADIYAAIMNMKDRPQVRKPELTDEQKQTDLISLIDIIQKGKK